MTQKPPPDSGSGERSSSARAIDWESLIDEWAEYSKSAVDRFAKRAKDNAVRARGGDYDRDAWFEDIQWLYDCAAEDARQALKCARETLKRQDDDTTA
jgi:hypothetical protein